jgi:prepilin-type N-terminal cleavage/methylation domain-containing protein
MASVFQGLRKPLPHDCAFSSDSDTLGFSLVEMLAVIMIILILSTITFIALQPVLNTAKVNEAYDDVLMSLRAARQRAITERKQYILVLGTPAPAGVATPLGPPDAKSIQLFRWDAGTALAAAVQISTVELPTFISFQTLPGMPTPGPDNFGTGAVALDFDYTANGGGTGGAGNVILFAPDGSAQDTNGNLLSGVCYLAHDGDLYSSRAVTLFGASGRIRGWRLARSAGAPQWVKQ